MAPMASYNIRNQTYKKKSKSKSLKAPKKFNYVKKQGNLLKDVAYLKRMVKRDKPEVKEISLGTPQSILVGQSDINLDGAGGFYISHTMQSGVGVNQRIGNNMKFIGAQIRLQFLQQSALVTGAHYIVDVFKFQDRSASGIPDIIDRVYYRDTISQLVDTNSGLDASYKKEYKRIFSRKVYMPADTQSSAANGIKDLKFFIKQNQVLEYGDATSSNPLNYGYCVIIRANTGNRNTTTAATTNLLFTKAANTGVQVSYTYKTFYTDM